MRLKYKLALWITFVGVITITLSLFTYRVIRISAASEERINYYQENADFISSSIEQDLLELVRLTETVASNFAITQFLNDSNSDFGLLNDIDRNILINDLNEEWKSTSDINSPFILERTENEVAAYLSHQQEQYPNLYGELFLTNKYGVMISTTGKLTTLSHSEKYWWQGAYDGGNGVVYIDDRGFDESADGYVLGIVVPIYDENFEIIGLLKSNYNISQIFIDSIENFHEIDLEGSYYIVRTKGLIVNGAEVTPLCESIDESILPYLEQKTPFSFEGYYNETKSFIAIAPIGLTYDSNLIEFGGSYESDDHTSGNLGEGWSLVYVIDSKIALASAWTEIYRILDGSLIIIIVVALGALLIGSKQSKPINALIEYINSVGEGKLTKKDITIKKDEIGDLTIAFNNMIDNLNETLTTKEVLQYERDKAQMYLDIIGVILIILDKDGTIKLINKKGCQILGATEEELLGANWFESFVPKDLISVMKEVFHDVFNNKQTLNSNYENKIHTKTGELITVKWVNTVIRDIDNNIVGILSSGEDVTQSNMYKDTLIKIGYQDALTGLNNRRYYEENLAILNNDPKNLPLTIVMADINGLKLVNDAFGHQAGDDLIKYAGKTISQNCQENHFAARIGGDEFVIVMPNTTHKIAEDIIKKIQVEAKEVSIQAIELSISFGLRTKNSIDEQIEEIYRSAEDAMYREKLLEIPSMRSSAIEAILSSLYEKDCKSEKHSESVSLIGSRLAKLYGLPCEDIDKVKLAGLLHDIGKIIISDEIINNPGKLSEGEYTVMKSHSEIGFRILNSTHDMRLISDTVLNHHERWDGLGYPRGIKGEDIPIKSRILSIADAYDAMTTDRTYNVIFSKEEAINELLENSGTQFDPKLVDIFISNTDKILM